MGEEAVLDAHGAGHEGRACLVLPRGDVCRSRIPQYWIWLNWFSTFKYPLHMMMQNEFGTLSDVCWEHLDGDSGVCVLTSPQVLYSFEIYEESLTVQVLIMVAMYVAYRIAFFCLLKMHTAFVRR